MCGIVGILGKHEAAPILLDALKRLEYRGYDSAGIATIEQGRLDRRRALGKLVNLADLLVHNPIKGKSGIGHTRWASHGVPSVDNAHPHQVGDRVAVVHNGIIENFNELRAQLESQGSVFTTQTDTEAVVHLCMQHLKAGDDPQTATRKTIAALEGAFALCFLFAGEDDLMIATRKGSPLAVGHGDGEMFVGSDAIALAPLSDRISYLEEGDMAIITRNSLTIYDEFGNPAKRSITRTQMGQTDIQKGQYRHYMAKEIAQQPVVLGNAVRHILSADRQRVELSDVDIDFSKVNRVTLVACGTAYLACMVAKYWFEDIAKIPVDVDIASEFRYRHPPLRRDDVAIFVSQSGETADTLAALRYCSQADMRTLGVVNLAQSSIAREASAIMEINAGIEIGVASTKAFSCQLVSLLALAAIAAQQNNALDRAQGKAIAAALNALPALMVDALAMEPEIQTAAQELSKAGNALFLGRGNMYPLALEGALKLKEISYIHAEGYASGELKHGPIALVDEHMPVIVFAPKTALFAKTISNMQEVIARGGKVLLFSDAEGIAQAGDDVTRAIAMPKCAEWITPMVYSAAAQLLAYHTALYKGTDVDQPRNLAKSVTVE